MRILQITKKFPWPVKDGEVIGIINLTTGLAQMGHTLTVLSLNTKKHYFAPANLPEAVKKMARFIAVDIDTTLSPVKAFTNLFTTQSYNVERFYSKAFENKIAELFDAERFDLILLESIYLMRYIDVIRAHTKAKVLVRPQNVEFIIWQRLADTESNFVKKQYLQLLANRMKRFELENMNRADMMLTLSQTDLDIFKQYGCNIPSAALPIGYVFDRLPAIDSSEENAVAFIGGMDWMPNREGVEWFINKVWPTVLKQVPGAKFYLAGRNFPDEIRNLKVQGLVVVGEVDDAEKFVFSKAVSIVPLFAGSGMRVKIIEAMALGRAIVSTSVGAESLAYTNGKDILIADDAASFANAVIKILQQQTLRKALGENAQQLILNKYDNRKLCAQVIKFCQNHIPA